MTATARLAPLVLATMAGCAAASLAPLNDEPAMAALRAAGSPLPLRVAVAMPVLRRPAPLPASGPVEWTPAEWQGLAVEALAAAGVAGKVRALGAATDPLASAWAAGDDLLLEIEIARGEVAYSGINGWFWPNVTGFLLFGVWPAWWVADERYTLRVEGEARLRATASGRELWRGPVGAVVEESLTDFERGLVLFGALRVPGALDAENWRAVAATLGPRARRGWQLALAAGLATDLRIAAGTEAFREATRQTLAVVVGCGTYFDPRLPNLKLPAEDARAVAGWLADAGIPVRQVRRLADAQATRAAILDALRTFVAPRARAGDRIVLYFAGYAGADGRGGVALLPYDADPNRLTETALPLGSLAEVLAAVPGADILCVIDAGLGGGTEGRWCPLGGDAPARGRVEADLERLVARPRTVVCWGCEAGEGAADADLRLRRGLWTFNWLRAATQARDRDGDGVVSSAEAFAHAREAVQTIGILTGQAQEPRLYGVTAAQTVAVPRAGRDAGPGPHREGS